MGQKPEAVAHFIGGAFIGAAPQLAYKDFLEAMAARRVMVSMEPSDYTVANVTLSKCSQHTKRCARGLLRMLL